jgi:hypothetical protein
MLLCDGPGLSKDTRPKQAVAGILVENASNAAQDVGGITCIVIDRLTGNLNHRSDQSSRQFSILPERTPQIGGLEIAAVYEPMSAVAGDLYDFLVADEQHVGFLVADVSGHGVVLSLSIPSLSRRFLGTLIFAAQALWVNVARRLQISVPNIYNSLGFAIFLLSIGYTGVEMHLAGNREFIVQ